MPIYDYKCEESGQVFEKIQKMDEMEIPCKCGSTLKRQLTFNFYAQSDLEPYLDHNIGKEPIYIKSKQHRRQLIKEQGVYEKYGKGWV